MGGGQAEGCDDDEGLVLSTIRSVDGMLDYGDFFFLECIAGEAFFEYLFGKRVSIFV